VIYLSGRRVRLLTVVVGVAGLILTAATPAATPGKNLYDNLEQEMASLLGRPSGKP